MEITSRPIPHLKNTNLVTITEDDGVHVDTWRVEMKFHHVLSVTWTKRTCDGLLVNAKLAASLPISVERELFNWYSSGIKK